MKQIHSKRGYSSSFSAHPSGESQEVKKLKQTIPLTTLENLKKIKKGQ